MEISGILIKYKIGNEILPNKFYYLPNHCIEKKWRNTLYINIFFMPIRMKMQQFCVFTNRCCYDSVKLLLIFNCKDS